MSSPLLTKSSIQMKVETGPTSRCSLNLTLAAKKSNAIQYFCMAQSQEFLLTRIKTAFDSHQHVPYAETPLMACVLSHDLLKSESLVEKQTEMLLRSRTDITRYEDRLAVGMVLLEAFFRPRLQFLASLVLRCTPSKDERGEPFLSWLMTARKLFA